jgi:adenylate cyclase
MSFRHKLLAAFLSLLGAILGAALWTVDRVETRRAEDELRSGLERTRDAFDDRLRERDDELARDLALLSGDFAFKQAIATGDRETVLSAALNHKARMGADVLIVTDGDGALLADTRGRKDLGVDWRKRPYIAAALRGQPAKGLFMLDGPPYQLAAIAIDPPDAIGVVVAGFQIDDRFARRLKKTTLSDVTFVSSGAVFGTRLEPHFHDAIAAQAGGLGGEPRQLMLGAERFLASATGSQTPVTAILMRSLDQACEPLRALQRLLLTIGLVGLAATALLGLAIAAGITRSLEQLARAAGKIALGQYDIELNIPSRDEIGRLGLAFSSMAKGLVEREKIRSILHKSVSKEIAESLVSQGKIELGGEEKLVTVLFSDIRSFTTLSESLAPKELVAQLNEYFTGMARAIDAHHGVIDKYIGDAVMALFGAPLATGQDPANALRAPCP